MFETGDLQKFLADRGVPMESAA